MWNSKGAHQYQTREQILVSSFWFSGRRLCEIQKELTSICSRVWYCCLLIQTWANTGTSFRILLIIRSNREIAFLETIWTWNCIWKLNRFLKWLLFCDGNGVYCLWVVTVAGLEIFLLEREVSTTSEEWSILYGERIS